jgi:hypothetical protein
MNDGSWAVVAPDLSVSPNYYNQSRSVASPWMVVRGRSLHGRQNGYLTTLNFFHSSFSSFLCPPGGNRGPATGMLLSLGGALAAGTREIGKGGISLPEVDTTNSEMGSHPAFFLFVY